jgi:hypothetical protein
MRRHSVFTFPVCSWWGGWRMLVSYVLALSVFIATSHFSYASSYNGVRPANHSHRGNSTAGQTPTDSISWPAGQLFPHFCCITTPLDEIDATNLNAEQNITFVTLEGLINRSKPRIYVLAPSREDPHLWPAEMMLKLRPVADPYLLFLKYRREIAGLVIYDPAMPDTINLATTIAGIKGGVVASPTEAAKLSTGLYNLPTLVDLRMNKFSSADAVYQYAYTNYWLQPGAEHRLLIGLPPGPSGLRDYAIATKAIVVWLDAGSVNDPMQKTLLDSFYQSMNAGSSYVGWFPSEVSGVRETSTYGIATFAADLAQNLTVLGAGSHTIRHRPPLSPYPVLQNKIYVSLFMSDGDNIQIDQHLLPQKWADPLRGSVPIGWTIDPALVDMAPAILNYYWRTASHNDELVAGPSGAGYVYPDRMSDAALNTYTQQSARYLHLAGMDIATIWNDTNQMPDRVGSVYARNAINAIIGLTTQNLDQTIQATPRLYCNELAVLPMGVAYAKSEAELETVIMNAANGFASSMGPRFIPVQADLNSLAINPTALYHVMQYFSNNPNIVFVGPEELFHLFTLSYTAPANNRSNLQWEKSC